MEEMQVVIMKRQHMIFFISQSTITLTAMTHEDEGNFPYFWNSPSFQFKHPFGARVVGPTQAGKSHFVIKLIQHAQLYISPSPTKIYWAYGEKNENQMKMIQSHSPIPIHFIEGMPDLEDISSDEINLLILDDLMTTVSNSKSASDLFTRASHHRNMSVIFIVQNLYHQGKSTKDISLNEKYTVLFKNPHDKGQVQYFGRKIFPEHPRFLIDAYEQATSRPHGYLIIIFDQMTPDNQRVRTGIFPPEIPLIFIPKKQASKT